ncbi:MAG TPA: Rieske 2Fe-2S domain-containing protein [Thermoanaerobaculia bacterium]|nr:Rieske 2Fe-2S domain-containing protein [Thermoanaerobaculia bacterium]
MSAGYVAVGWSGRKKRYDAVLGVGVALYLAAFVGLGAWLFPEATAETLLIRAFGTAAFLLLHVVLAIGPLCRLDPRFLPLLYNRRHLGVLTFILGLAHGTFALIQFHAGGDANPFISLLTSNGRWNSLADFPFQQLGAAALGILFLMAATSHDFWLANLSPRVWKTLHMGVYLAYALLVMHVALGALQDERSPWLAGSLGLGIATILGLHLAAAVREKRRDRPLAGPSLDGFLDVGAVAEIPEKRAKVVVLGAERVAIFRYDGKISALSNVCRHQNGPLGEGKIVDGCITCPWHGYQYLPDSGSSPPPFQEKVETYRVAVRDGRVLVHPQALPPGTRVEPARIADSAAPDGAEDASEFFIGWQEPLPPRLGRRIRAVAAAGVVLALGVGLLLAAAQKPFAPAVFEYGRPRFFTGRLQASPIPILWVSPPDRHPDVASAGYALAAPAKHGAAGLAAPWAGRAVRLRGTLIRRAGRGMIEVEPGSIEPWRGSAPPLPAGQRLGPATVDGVIADSKCWLGAMSPGEGKIHRDCAVRCLSGGLPPLLLGAGPEGKNFWLTGPGGRAIGARILDRVAEPVRLRGEVVRFDDQLVFEVESDAVVRREPGR